MGVEPTSGQDIKSLSYGITLDDISPYAIDPQQSSRRATAAGASGGGFPTEMYCSAMKSITLCC